MRGRNLFLLAFTFIILAVLFTGSSQAEIAKPRLNLMKKDIMLQVDGYFAIGHSSNYEEVFGYLDLKHNGNPYKDARVMLGNMVIPQKSPGHYSFQDLNIPINNKPVELKIAYSSGYSMRKNVITINGIVVGTCIKITRPDSTHFLPFVSDTYKVSWSGINGKTLFYINNLTDNSTTIFKSENVIGTSIAINSALFTEGSLYKFYLQGRKGLRISGPATSNSSFYFEKQSTIRSTCKRLTGISLQKNKPVIKKKATKFYKKPTTVYKKPKPITIKKSSHVSNLQMKVVDLACSLKTPSLLPSNNKVRLRASVFVLESGGKKLAGRNVTFLFTMKNERNSVIRSESVTLRIKQFPTPTIAEVHIPIEDVIANHPIHVKVELDPGDKFLDKNRSNNTKSKTFWLK